jgi:hypothetical protein
VVGACTVSVCSNVQHPHFGGDFLGVGRKGALACPLGAELNTIADRSKTQRMAHIRSHLKHREDSAPPPWKHPRKEMTHREHPHLPPSTIHQGSQEEEEKGTPSCPGKPPVTRWIHEQQATEFARKGPSPETPDMQASRKSVSTERLNWNDMMTGSTRKVAQA